MCNAYREIEENVHISNFKYCYFGNGSVYIFTYQKSALQDHDGRVGVVHCFISSLLDACMVWSDG